MAIRWGLIGTGDVAERKGGPPLYQVERCRLVAVHNRTLAAAQGFATRHGNPKVYESAEQLVTADDVDAVYVATPPSSHAHYTEMAAKAGKHVLCEKPMAMSVKECQRMIEICDQNDVSLSIAFYRREFPVVRKMKALLEASAIGKPLSIVAQTYAPFASPSAVPWRLDPEVSGGGFLMDMGSHRFDLFVHFFGPATHVAGFAEMQSLSKVADDAATVSLRFEGGEMGTASFHWNTSIHRDNLMIVGSDGVLSVEDLSGRGQLTLETVQGKQHWSLPSSAPVHLGLVERLTEHLLDGMPNPCSGEEGLATAQIIEQVANRV